MLHRTGHLCQTGGRWLRRQIGATLCKDRRDRTASVGKNIVAELAWGSVQEAFRHLKGWYQAAMEMQSKPCYHTMEHQTSERVDLYARRQSPGDPLPIHLTPVKINDNVLPDSKIRTAIGELMNGDGSGASWRRRTLRARGMQEKGIIGICSLSWYWRSGPMAPSLANCFGRTDILFCMQFVLHAASL